MPFSSLQEEPARLLFRFRLLLLNSLESVYASVKVVYTVFWNEERGILVGSSRPPPAVGSLYLADNNGLFVPILKRCGHRAIWFFEPHAVIGQRDVSSNSIAESWDMVVSILSISGCFAVSLTGETISHAVFAELSLGDGTV